MSRTTGDQNGESHFDDGNEVACVRRLISHGFLKLRPGLTPKRLILKLSCDKTLGCGRSAQRNRSVAAAALEYCPCGRTGNSRSHFPVFLAVANAQVGAKVCGISRTHQYPRRQFERISGCAFASGLLAVHALASRWLSRICWVTPKRHLGQPLEFLVAGRTPNASRVRSGTLARRDNSLSSSE